MQLTGKNSEGSSRFYSGVEEILQAINQLPSNQRMEVKQRLLGDSGLFVVLESNNVVNSSIAIHLNTSSDQIEENLKDIPLEILGELLEAVSSRIARDYGEI